MLKLIEVYRSNEKLSIFTSYLLVIAMMVCIGITARLVLDRILPDRNLSFLPYYCILVSLAGIFSQRRLHRSSEMDISPWVYRAVEWIVILVFLKLFIYAWNGFGQLLADLPRWQADFFQAFFEADFLISFVLLFTVWILSISYVEDLIDLEGDVQIIQASDLDLVVSNRSEIQSRLSSRVISTGVVLVLITTFLRLDYSTVFQGLHLGKQSLFHIYVYFLLGLVLLSVTQLATRRAVWAWEHIPISHSISKNWIIYSLSFLILLSLVAYILPTSYTLGLFPTLQYFFTLLFSLAYSLVLLIVIPVILFISWIMSLFGESRDVQTPLTFPEQIIPPLPDRFAAEPSPLIAVIKSILFWGILFTVLIYAFIIYFRQNKGLWQQIQRLPAFHWIINIWQALISWAKTSLQFIPEAIKASVKRRQVSRGMQSQKGIGDYISLRSLNHRQRIMFYYFALLRRTRDLGAPRKLWQTPHKYVRDITQIFPDAETEIDGITNAFCEARYTQHIMDDQTARRAQKFWSRLRSSVNSKRRR